MKRGYARVSTKRQELHLQLDALKASGCEEIYTDKLSGARDDRPELNRCLGECRPGDVLHVWKLDRAFRSFNHCVVTIAELDDRGVGFKCLTQPDIDTTTSTGKLMFRIFAAMAEFERDLIKERISAGLKAAKARGRQLGRRTVLGPERMASVKEMLVGGTSISQVARVTGISRATLYRHLGPEER